jgi:hypothetical protein
MAMPSPYHAVDVLGDDGTVRWAYGRRRWYGFLVLFEWLIRLFVNVVEASNLADRPLHLMTLLLGSKKVHVH